MILNTEKNLSLNFTNKYTFPSVIRFDTASGERVYREESIGKFIYYIGVSGFTKAFETGESKFGLQMWRDKMIEQLGVEKTNAYVRQTAEYGTIYTMLCAEYAGGNIKSNLDADDYIFDKLKEWDANIRTAVWYDMMQDFNSFYLWAKDWQVVFHAAEGFVCDRELYYGTPIDFIIEATNPENKTIKFQEYFINLKSGRDQSADMHFSQQKWEYNAIRQSRLSNNPIVGVVAPCKMLKKGLKPAKFTVQKFTDTDMKMIDLDREKAKLFFSKNMATITDIKFGDNLGDYEVIIYKNED